MAVPVYRPTIKRKNMDSVLTCMVSDHIGPGSHNRELASALSIFLDMVGGYCLSSYTEAIHFALDSLELHNTDAVVISALAPSLYLKLLKKRGLVPLIADVDPDSGVLLASEIEKCLSKKPKAVILYYTMGYIPDVEAITRFKIPIIEDLTQALGGRAGDRRCGSLGDVSVISLEPEGIITAGGGGILLARDKGIKGRIKQIIEEYSSNILLPDINAALGLSQMKDINKFIHTREEIAEVFSQSLAKSRHRTLVQPGEGHNINVAFPVLINNGLKEVRQYAMRKNIETMPAFSDSIIAMAESIRDPRLKQKSCPNAQNLFWRCLLFPLYPTLGRRNVQLISKVLSTLP